MDVCSGFDDFFWDRWDLLLFVTTYIERMIGRKEKRGEGGDRDCIFLWCRVFSLHMAPYGKTRLGCAIVVPLFTEALEQIYR